MKCKKSTDTESMFQAVSQKNNVPMLKGNCVICGSRKNRFLKKTSMQKKIF